MTDPKGHPMTPTTSTTADADRRAWIGLAVLAVPCMLVTMDLTVLFLALPKLVADLDPSATQQLWITDVYGFLIAGALILMGSLGDRVGRRRVLMVGGGAFGAASLLAALSQSPEQLIVARAIQGLAGATLVPSTMSLVFAMFPDERKRTAALGVIMSCFIGGAAAGPLIGGALLEAFDWNSVFLINVPVAVLLLVLAPRFLPEFKNPEAGRVDLASAVLLMAAILPTIYGIKQVAAHGAEVTSLLAIAAGVVLGVAFVARQRRLAEPLLDVSLFRTRAFSAALGSNVLGAFVMYGIFFFISQYFQLVLGMSPLESGLWSLPGLAAMMVVSSAIVPRLAVRIRPGYLVAGGMTICAAGFALLTQLSADDGLALLVLASTITSIGIAPGSTLGTNLIVGSAPAESQGAASGVAQTGNELGGALGIALLGTLGTTIYRNEIEGTIPNDAPAGAAASAHDTLGGAVAVAGQLPPGLLDAANTAFASGLHAAAAVCTIAMLAAAGITARFLRHVPPAGAGEEAAEDRAVAGPTATPAPEPA
jgi:DHA2 family multidrug resistance protein-like MFS transporter